MKITVTQMEGFPPNVNPYHYDLSNMGQAVGKGLHMMFGNHENEVCKYLILIDIPTGERYMLKIDQDDTPFPAHVEDPSEVMIDTDDWGG